MSKELFEKLNAKFFELEQLQTNLCKMLDKFEAYYEDICSMCSSQNERQAFHKIKAAASQALSSAGCNIASTSKALLYYILDCAREEE